MFAHTQVTIGEDSAEYRTTLDVDPDEEIFCFYNLKVDLPSSFLKKLGDDKLVERHHVEAIKDYILKTYPKT